MSYIGRKINIGLALETTRGTARTATMWMRKTNCSFEPKITKVVDEGSLGVIHDAACSTVANERAEGDLETNLSLNII
ncbi:MAG: hypothetical protein LBD75_07370 [Candidatus Peribacteria bacterium]|jgi:hypothetical protein|nr:hypothetical protein [Candidatus Peribacteria bacterium]